MPASLLLFDIQDQLFLTAKGGRHETFVIANRYVGRSGPS